jgi:hypothetical protein
MIGMRLLFLAIISSSFSFSQGLELGPMTSNPSISFNKKTILKTGSNSIDSTFIFSTDTLSLPFYDEFSSNKFQKYQEDFSANGVTSILYHRLIDPLDSLPLSASTILTNQQTFNRIYDASTSTFVDNNFQASSVIVGDLTSYPVQYQLQNLFPPYYMEFQIFLIHYG